MERTLAVAIPVTSQPVRLVVTFIEPFESDIEKLKGLAAYLKTRPIWGSTWYEPIKGEPLRFCTMHPGPVDPDGDWVLDPALGNEIRRRLRREGAKLLPIWRCAPMVESDDPDFDYKAGWPDDESFFRYGRRES